MVFTTSISYFSGTLKLHIYPENNLFIGRNEKFMRGEYLSHPINAQPLPLSCNFEWIPQSGDDFEDQMKCVFKCNKFGTDMAQPKPNSAILG